MSDKSNIQHLRDILKELTVANAAKQEEASEFLDAIQVELKERDDEIKELKDEVEDYEEDGPEYKNSDDVGLDTINWETDHGNLRIEEEMENFIKILQKKYIGVSAS